MKRFLSIPIAVVLSFSVALVWADDKSDVPYEPPKKEEKSSRVSSIQGGKTTKSDVRAMCGEPVSLRNTDSGEEWGYFYGENRSLDVQFNKVGVVTDYRYKGSAALPQQDQKVETLAGEKSGTVHCDLCPIYCTRTVCTLNGCRNEQYICQWYSCNCGGY